MTDLNSTIPEGQRRAEPDVTAPHKGWLGISFTLWRYIARQVVGPIVMALVVIMFVFTLQFLMRFIDRIVGRGLGVWVITQLIAYNLAWMVVLAVPMSVLVACVMAFGSMGAANEITAMKAAGTSLGRMLIPVILLGLGMTVFDFWFNDQILPDANHTAKDLMSDIQRKKPTFVIEPGQFTDDDALPGFSILARHIEPKTDILQNVTIYDHSQISESRVFTAERAKLQFTKDFRNIVLTLMNGEMHEFFPQQASEYRRGKFDSYIVQIPTNGYDFMHQGESERGGRELSVQNLLRYVHVRDTAKTKIVTIFKDHLRQLSRNVTSNMPLFVLPGALRTTPLRAELEPSLMLIDNDLGNVRQMQEDIDSYMVEVHKKYAIPAACIVFVLIGAPLGALARRGGVGPGVGLSIGFFVLYWAFLIGGEKLADRGVITPFEGMWGGNILLLAVGIYLTWRVAREAPPTRITLWTKQLFAEIGRLLKRKQPGSDQSISSIS